MTTAGQRLLVATANLGKLREFAAALERVGLAVVGLESLEDRTPVEESGSTFAENARLKAEGFSKRTELPVIADDSGIEVAALDHRPGVQSARYGGPDLDDEGRVRLLLRELEGVPEERRAGRFRCVLALARGGRTLATFEGSVEGRITHEPRGDNGFGYDPVFFHEGVGCTFAELSREDKEKLSHRGQAVRKLIEAVRTGRIEV